jgi:hypothetical protein
MASSSAQPPAGNSINHESVDLPSENSAHWSKDLVQKMDTTLKKVDDMQKDLLKIKDDIATLRQSFANTFQTIDRLKQLMLAKPVPPHDNSTSTQ